MAAGDTPLTQQQIADNEQQAAHEAWWKRVLVAGDDFFNVVGLPLLTPGLPDETISSHVRRIVDDKEGLAKLDPAHRFIAETLNQALNFLQAQHGARAEAGDLERAEAVEQAEETALGEK